MRIRNKELRQRWHRKEQRVKELIAEAKKSKSDAPKAKAAPKPVAEKKAPAAKKPKAEPVEGAAEKPKKAPAKKKAEASE